MILTTAGIKKKKRSSNGFKVTANYRRFTHCELRIFDCGRAVGLGSEVLAMGGYLGGSRPGVWYLTVLY